MSIESERIVIGQLVNFAEHRATAAEKLSPSDFTGIRAQIFAELKREIDAGNDFQSGDAEIEIGKRIEGGAHEFATCYIIAAERISFGRHLEAVQAASHIRRALAALAAAHNVLASDEYPPTTLAAARELVASVSDGIMLAASERAIARLQSQAEVMREFERNFDARRREDAKIGISTGLEAFDEKTGGLCAGETFVLAARPGVGKTATMLAMLMGVCRTGAATLVQSLEMSFLRLFEREYAAASGIFLSKLRDPRAFGPSDEARLARGYSALIAARVHYGASSTIAQIRRDCMALRARNELDVLFVDYLGLIEPASGFGTRERQVADISRGLKLIATDLKIPVVVLSQLNRASKETDEPNLNELRDSGAVEQDASAVLMLWGDQKEKSVNWKLAKNRNGELASGVFDFERATQRISNFRIVQPTTGNKP